MIKIITNSEGSGDWVIVQNGDEILFSGHRISPMELASILEQLEYDVDLISVTDEEMEQFA